MDCPLYISHRQAGILRITPEGRDTRFTVRACANAGIYRLIAKGEQGDLLLGVWDGSAMSRRFSREMTAPAGRIISAEAVPVEGAAEPWLPAPAERFPRWHAAGGLCRRRGEGWQLAVPFADDGPFPFPSLFCLSQIGRVKGQQMAIFCFDEKGQPIFPADY